MASTTQVALIDDLDGAAATETVTFSLDRQHYEIDVSARNVGTLRKVVGPYAEAARRLTTPRRGRGRPYRRVHTKVDPAAIRAWAIANDYEISAPGRVSAAIIEEYRTAGNQPAHTDGNHSDTTPQTRTRLRGLVGQNDV